MEIEADATELFEDGSLLAEKEIIKEQIPKAKSTNSTKVTSKPIFSDVPILKKRCRRQKGGGPLTKIHKPY
jgi:hypothetical protein